MIPRLIRSFARRALKTSGSISRFVTTPAAKERLKPLVLEGNRQKVTDAPVTAIIGYDTRFYDRLPRLFPHVDARSWFIDKPGFAETTAFRNCSLQGAYFIMAARAIGLDCERAGHFSERDFASGLLCERWCRRKEK
jgi:nitroreductase